jgi:hypothetical protein
MEETMSTEQPKKGFIERYGPWIGAIVGIFTFIFLIFPDLQPTPRPDVDIEISTIGMERDISYEMYLARQGVTAPKDLTCKELTANGMVIKPTIKLTGLKGKEIQAKTSLYKADRGLAPSSWFLGLEWLQGPDAEYTPTSNKDTWVFDHWVLYPQADANFYLRLELFLKDKNGLRPLGYKDTEPFAVPLFPECAGPPPDPPYPPDALTPPPN